MKLNKILRIGLVVLDVAITLFLLVISIIMLVKTLTMSTPEILSDYNKATFIGFLQNNSLFYFLVFVLPLFILLAANIIFLVIYVRKTTKAEPVKMDELTEEQKAELRKQILADLQKQKTSETVENPSNQE
jgi:hypothetical protein